MQPVRIETAPSLCGKGAADRFLSLRERLGEGM